LLPEFSRFGIGAGFLTLYGSFCLTKGLEFGETFTLLIIGLLGETFCPVEPLRCIGIYVERPLDPDLSPETPYLGLGIPLSAAGDMYLLFERFRFPDPE